MQIQNDFNWNSSRFLFSFQSCLISSLIPCNARSNDLQDTRMNVMDMSTRTAGLPNLIREKAAILSSSFKIHGSKSPCLSSLSVCPFYPTETNSLVLASLNEKVQSARLHLSATTLQIPALWLTGAGELSGSDPWVGPFWPEPVLRTRAFHLRTDWSDRPD